MRAGYWLSLFLLVGLTWGYAHYRDLRGEYAKFQESEKSVRELRHRLETNRQEEERLKRAVADLDKDPVEWEAAIRSHKGFAREGEKVYRVETTPR